MTGEPPSCAVDANPSCVARASENRCDLTSTEVFPGNKGKELSIIGAQTRECASSRIEVDLGARRLCLDPWSRLATKALGQALATTRSTLLVGDHTTSGAVEPELGSLTSRNFVEPAPGDDKRFCDHIAGVIYSDPPNRVPEHAVVVLLVKRLEPLDARMLAWHAGQR
jgi:hypothetical protein